jgi:hypothetical protein
VTLYVSGGVPPYCLRGARTKYVPAVALDGIYAFSIIVFASVSDIAWDAEAPVASVTVTVKLDVPGDVGVPTRLQVLLTVKPAGKLPLVTAHVVGAIPPTTGMGCPKTFS